MNSANELRRFENMNPRTDPGGDEFLSPMNNAVAAIKLTLLVAAIAVPANVIFGLSASWAIAKFEFTGKSVLNHADRSSLLGLAGDLGPDLCAVVRLAGLPRSVAARATTSRSSSRCPALCWPPSSLPFRSSPAN